MDELEKPEPNSKYKEKDLYTYWINFCRSKICIKSVQLKGLDAGILNDRNGPDFQGAEFELNGKIYRGDVEIHFNTQNWFQHGHHLDQRYDRVMLHLVESSNTFEVYNSKNQAIPTISFKNFPICAFPNNSFQLNKNQNLTESNLQSLALQRMNIKSLQIQNNIASFGIDQTLYAKILILLGSTANKNNYERLSQILPWKLISSQKVKYHSLEFWIAITFGAAGLLSELQDSNCTQIWQKFLPFIEGIPLNRESWNYGGIRPKNFPANRLLGLAKLIHFIPEPSIYNSLEPLFLNRFPIQKFTQNIFKLFETFNNNKYWGRKVILELTGNVFIPLFYYIAKKKNSFGFESYLKQLYLELPRTQDYGQLNMFSGQIINLNHIRKYFYFNQALLQFQNNCNVN